jgi:hypothetical protein
MVPYTILLVPPTAHVLFKLEQGALVRDTHVGDGLRALIAAKASADVLPAERHTHGLVPSPHVDHHEQLRT